MKRVAWLLILMVGCIDPYTPPEIKPAGALLVINGHIDVNSKSIIKLTRSQNLFENEESEKVNNASVWLEDENGLTYPLEEEGDGIYSLIPQAFAQVKHRLNVETEDQKKYSSEFVEIKNSPPIDSVSWEVTSDLGVKIYANTHSSETNTGYYRWKFEETWLYRSAYPSDYVYNNDTHAVDFRQGNIYECWRSEPSFDVLISSTSRLSENAIRKFPLTSIDQRNEKLKLTYSILVKQYSLTEDAFLYWKQLEKTTEDLGTIFSPMPSQVRGNFLCTSNPEETVLGYLSIGASAETRIFISSLQLPNPITYNTYYKDCGLKELMNADVPFFAGPFLIVGEIHNPRGPGAIGYYYTTIPCADCRVAGGTNVKPDFWP